MNNSLPKNNLAHQLKKLIDAYKKKAGYKIPNEVSDSEALGRLISSYSGWDGKFIFNVAYAGFEDSNFHAINRELKEAWLREEMTQ